MWMQVVALEIHRQEDMWWYVVSDNMILCLLNLRADCGHSPMQHVCVFALVPDFFWLVPRLVSGTMKSWLPFKRMPWSGPVKSLSRSWGFSSIAWCFAEPKFVIFIQYPQCNILHFLHSVAKSRRPRLAATYGYCPPRLFQPRRERVVPVSVFWRQAKVLNLCWWGNASE